MARLQLCLVLFYLVLSLAIIPEMGGGDWVDVKCRATEAAVASEPSTVRQGFRPVSLFFASVEFPALNTRAARRCAAARAT